MGIIDRDHVDGRAERLLTPTEELERRASARRPLLAAAVVHSYGSDDVVADYAVCVGPVQTMAFTARTRLHPVQSRPRTTTEVPRAAAAHVEAPAARRRRPPTCSEARLDLRFPFAHLIAPAVRLRCGSAPALASQLPLGVTPLPISKLLPVSLLGALACSGADLGPNQTAPAAIVAAASSLTAPSVAEAQAPPGIVAAGAVVAADAAPASSGSFLALTYNVAGLPEILSRSRPSVHMPQIGKRLDGYDLVLLQESWQTPSPNPAAPLRCYHEMLVAAAQHRFKTPAAVQPFGSDRRRPSALLADGLNVFSKLPLASTRRVPWNRCVNTFNDCYALKGFSMTPLQLAPGATVHVYNLHMEAGWSEEDDAARDDAIDQLLAYIDEHSRGRALIVGGDFNLRGDRARTTAQLAKLRDGAALTDACVRCARPRNVDKILYRSSAQVTLDADLWRLETDVFKSEGGEPLSDHAPLAVRFSWSKPDVQPAAPGAP